MLDRFEKQAKTMQPEAIFEKVIHKEETSAKRYKPNTILQSNEKGRKTTKGAVGLLLY